MSLRGLHETMLQGRPLDLARRDLIEAAKAADIAIGVSKYDFQLLSSGLDGGALRTRAVAVWTAAAAGGGAVGP